MAAAPRPLPLASCQQEGGPSISLILLFFLATRISLRLLWGQVQGFCKAPGLVDNKHNEIDIVTS